MKRSFDASRRRFLATAGALSAVGPVAAPFALNLATIGAAAAQSVSDYRALVCVYLGGANDAFNTVLATDTDSWNGYTAARNVLPDPLVLPLAGFTDGVLPILPATVQSGRAFALHGQMGDMKTLFDAGRAAIVANVGPLIEPTSRAQYRARSVRLPPKLFSHNDQTSMWQAFGPEGATRGWGGRLGDLFASQNTNASFTAVSASGNVVWLSGESVRQYQMTGTGALPVAGTSGALYGSSTASGALRAIVSGPRDHLIMREQAAMTDRSINTATALNGALISDSALPAAPRFNDVTNALAVQLRLVARMIGGRSALGARRQVFMVSIGGFDTHDFQNRDHGRLLGRVSQALAYFDTLMSHSSINAQGMVTAFTASEFGRTLSSNGDGTDHGWGGHHFVVGGAVRGGDIWGRFPVIGVNGADDAGRGSMIPAIAVDQYAGVLARWFGVPNSGLYDLFPNLSRFGSGSDFGLPASLRFMNA
jgi:uncharacterized protein (DUF1501 family)